MLLLLLRLAVALVVVRGSTLSSPVHHHQHCQLVHQHAAGVLELVPLLVQQGDCQRQREVLRVAVEAVALSTQHCPNKQQWHQAQQMHPQTSPNLRWSAAAALVVVASAEVVLSGRQRC